MYKDRKDFGFERARSKGDQLRNLSILNTVFTEKTPELERFNVISFYCVSAELDRQYALSEIKDLAFELVH